MRQPKPNIPKWKYYFMCKNMHGMKLLSASVQGLTNDRVVIG